MCSLHSNAPSQSELSDRATSLDLEYRLPVHARINQPTVIIARLSTKREADILPRHNYYTVT